VLVRIAAWASLVFGLYGFVAALSLWGAAAGAVMGALALLFGWACLTERPSGVTRRVAQVGVAAGVGAFVVVLIWIMLAILGV